VQRATDVNQFFASYLNDAVEMWNSPVESFADNTIKDMIDQVLHKKQKPQDALQAAQAVLQAKVDEVMPKS
jgi:hypothetical protein